MVFDKLKNFKIGIDRPLICLEVNPPRGADCSKIFERLEQCIEYIDYFNVTDSALARMKMNSLCFAALLKNRFGIEPVVNLACRDRNSIALQADLLAGWALGVRSVVALTGDAVSVGDNSDAKAVFEVNSIGLLGIIDCLSQGRDKVGNLLTGQPSYLAGVVANPNAKNISAEIRKLERKKQAGATFVLTQPVFSIPVALEFLEQAKILDIPIFLGLMPIANGKSVIGISKVPGIKLPEDLMTAALADPDCDLKESSFQLGKELVTACRDQVVGFHIISGANPQLGLDFTKVISKFV